MSPVAVRRTTAVDAAGILRVLRTPEAKLEQLQGRTVEDVIDASVLCVTVLDEHDAVVGFVAFDDTPNAYGATLAGLDRQVWAAELQERYELRQCVTTSTLWISAFAADLLYEKEVVESTIHAAFSTLPHLEQVLAVLPRAALSPIQTVFQAVTEKAGSQDDEAGAAELLICLREAILPPIVVRPAKVEDHDDLLPIFNRQTDLLTANYGEFFLAKLIAAQRPADRALVAEVDGRAFGFMSLTCDVDVSILQQCFDLEAYDGLRKEVQDEAPATARSAVSDASSKSGSTLRNALEGQEEANSSACTGRVLKRSASIPIRDGADNVFCITLLCVDENVEARSVELLRAAFKAFPSREYCLVTLPHAARETPLLSYFTQVAPLPSNTFSHVLYLLHRDSVFLNISVRAMEKSDLAQVNDLLNELDNGPTVLALSKVKLEESSARPTAAPSACVVECERQIVGLVLLDNQPDVDVCRKSFALEHLSVSEQPPNHDTVSELLYYVVNPLFKSRSRQILQEVLRRLNKWCVLYRIFEACPLQDVLQEFIQVIPRHVQQQPSPLHDDDLHLHVESSGASTEVSADMQLLALDVDRRTSSTFSLFALPKRLLSEPKQNVNARIVVVGASTTGLSVLETFLTVPHINFTHLTLVSESVTTGVARRGVPAYAPTQLEMAESRLARLALDRRIRIVNCLAVDFNRKAKVLHLRNGHVIPYDFLVLAPGLQDQTANALLGDAAEEVTGLTPVTNTANDAHIHHAITLRNANAPVMVYGSSLRALTAIQGVLASGVEAGNIMWVNPLSARDASWCFGDPEVNERVLSTLETQGVHVIADMELQSVQLEGGSIASVMLRSNNLGLEQKALEVKEASSEVAQPLTNSSEAVWKQLARPGPDPGTFQFNCGILLGAAAPDIGKELFRAVLRNSLVYDGRLVVDADFCTADASILAGGPCAKFSRKFAGAAFHQDFSSAALGRQLAFSLLRRLDPAGLNPSPSSVLINLQQSAVSEAGILPGGQCFYRVWSPASKIDPQNVGSARVLTTNQYGRLCRLVIDGVGAVQSFHCLGAEYLAETAWRAAIGRPVTYLRDLVQRYDQGDVSDLLIELDAPWSEGLYLPGFEKLRRQIRQDLAGRDDMQTIFAVTKELSTASKVDIETIPAVTKQTPKAARRAVESRILGFLMQHKTQLPRYTS